MRETGLGQYYRKKGFMLGWGLGGIGGRPGPPAREECTSVVYIERQGHRADIKLVWDECFKGCRLHIYPVFDCLLKMFSVFTFKQYKYFIYF